MFEQYALKRKDVVDFKLSALEPYLREGVPTPVLKIKPATADNSEFMNRYIDETFKRTGRRTVQMNAKTLATSREIDLDLFPELVIVGWEDVVDSNGDAVPFTAEVCRQFFDRVDMGDKSVFDTVRDFARQPTNFAEAAAGN